MILQLVNDRLAARLHERPIERCAHLEGKSLVELATMLWRKRVEPVHHDLLDTDRFALVDDDLQPNRLLIVAELSVERADLRGWKAAVLVERDDALEVSLELRPGEVLLFSPGNLRAHLRRDNLAQLAGGDGAVAAEGELFHGDAGGALA